MASIFFSPFPAYIIRRIGIDYSNCSLSICSRNLWRETAGLTDTQLYITECANSSQCAPFKHHFDECVERVTRQQEDPNYKGPKEDCVEECKFSIYPSSRSSGDEPIHTAYPNMKNQVELGLSDKSDVQLIKSPTFANPSLPNLRAVFHLQHCATQCAAPKLWKALK